MYTTPSGSFCRLASFLSTDTIFRPDGTTPSKSDTVEDGGDGGDVEDVFDKLENQEREIAIQREVPH